MSNLPDPAKPGKKKSSPILSQRDALVESLLANPWEDADRNILADYLAENGMDAQAEALRKLYAGLVWRAGFNDSDWKLIPAKADWSILVDELRNDDPGVDDGRSRGLWRWRLYDGEAVAHGRAETRNEAMTDALRVKLKRFLAKVFAPTEEPRL